LNLDSLYQINAVKRTISISHYQKGELSGDFTTITKSGKTLERMLYEGGKELLGSRTYYDTLGNNVSEWLNDSLRKKQIFLSYHPNGKMNTRMEYRDSLLDGHVMNWDTAGTLISDYLFNNGVVNLTYSPKTDSMLESNKVELYTQLTHKNIGSIYRKYLSSVREETGTMQLVLFVTKNACRPVLIYSDIQCENMIRDILQEIGRLHCSRFRLKRDEYFSVGYSYHFIKRQ
jgi:hypothetical protein